MTSAAKPSSPYSSPGEIFLNQEAARGAYPGEKAGRKTGGDKGFTAEMA